MTNYNVNDTTGLVTFTPGTTIRAAEVNANFEEIRTSVNDND